MHQIDDDVFVMDSQSFSGLVVSMLRDEDVVGLTLLLDRLTSKATTTWRTASATSPEAVRTAWTETVELAIERIGWISLSSLHLRSSDGCQEAVERLGWLYDLKVLTAPVRFLGEDGFLPQRAVLTQLYAIGAYAVFRNRVQTLRDALSVQVYRYGSRQRAPLWSRDGLPDALDSYEDVKEYVRKRESIFGLFLADDKTVRISLSQFRLLAAYLYWCESEPRDLWISDCLAGDLDNLILRLLKPGFGNALYGFFDLDQFARFLRHYSNHLQWQAGPIAQFLKEHAT